MHNPGEGLSAFPEGISRDGSRIYEAADYTDELVNTARTAREELGVPWGESGDYAKEMEDILGPAEETLWQLLDLIAVAQRDTADSTIDMANGFHQAEEANHGLAAAADVGTKGIQGGRR